MEEILYSFLQQIFMTIGLIVIFGLLCSLCRNGFVKLLGNAGAVIINRITGVVGVPIHELSHALFSFIFGHQIVEINLFNPDSEDGTLGSVLCNYNKKNILHIIGLFFSGIGPILGGTAVITLLMVLIVPDVSTALFENIGYNANIFGEIDVFESLLSTIFIIFTEKNFNNIWFWVFLILALMIASHMELSTPDIKNALPGGLIIMGIFLVIDVILYLIYQPALFAFTAGINYFGSFLFSILLIGGIFNICFLMIAVIIRLIGKILIRE